MGKKKLLESRCSPSYIYDMMSTLSKNNSIEKLAEIDLIGFGFLRLVPNWSVKQAIMVHLAESYQVKPRTFILDIGNIHLNAELIGKVFGIPSQGTLCYLVYLVMRRRAAINMYLYAYILSRNSTHEHVVGDPFPALDESNSSHVAIKNRFHRRSTTELRDLVYSCPMTTESERMEFRRYFILVVMKMFLCPTTQQVLSSWHIYPVLDVSDPRRFNWPLEILKWFDMAVEKYKLKGNKTCEGRMFIVLGRLLTRHGVGDDIKGRSPQAARRKPGKKEPQKRQQKQSVLPRRRSVGGESKQVSNERPPRGRTSSPPPTARSSRHAKRSETSTRVRELLKKKGEAKKDRPRRCPPKKSEEKDLPSGTDDDEENEPLAKRMCRLYKQGVDKKNQVTNQQKATSIRTREPMKHQSLSFPMQEHSPLR
ncbi:hypothetical protein AHAS_Ahas16G0085800 [Arachis hypogaea]